MFLLEHVQKKIKYELPQSTQDTDVYNTEARGRWCKVLGCLPSLSSP
jgi:hypothetical protein